MSLSDPQTASAAIAGLAEDLTHRLLQVEQWSLLTSRVLRERTAGSFDRLFLQGDSVASYRGGLQKMLFIAENLMQEFHDSLPPFLRSTDDGPVMTFSAVYEPKTSITSHPDIGLVNVPLRYAFAIHLLVPQFWHEVGQYVAHRIYDREQHATLLEREGELHKHWKKTLPTAPHVQAQDRDLALPSSMQSAAVNFDVVPLRALLFDMLADLVVCYFGFRMEFRDFAVYLASLIDKVVDYEGKTRIEARQRPFVELFIRLYFVSQFKVLLVEAEKLPAPEAGTATASMREEDLIAELDVHASRMRRDSARIMSYIIEVVTSNAFRGRRESVPDSVRKAATTAVTTPTYTRFFAKFLRDFVVSFRRYDVSYSPRSVDAVKWREVTCGRLADLSDEVAVGDYYFELFREELERLVEREPGTHEPPRFQHMAALGRSALLAFYARRHRRMGATA